MTRFVAVACACIAAILSATLFVVCINDASAAGPAEASIEEGVLMSFIIAIVIFFVSAIYIGTQAYLFFNEEPSEALEEE